jgi:ribonuclease P protein subunit RPR2
MKYKDKSYHQQSLAQERIVKLFNEAQNSFEEYPELSKRYVILAKKLSTRYKVRFTTNQKNLFCKNCNSFFKNGINVRIRLEHGVIVQTCLICNAVKRISYKKNSKSKNKLVKTTILKHTN